MKLTNVTFTLNDKPMKTLLWCNKVPKGKRNKPSKINGIQHHEISESVEHTYYQPLWTNVTTVYYLLTFPPIRAILTVWKQTTLTWITCLRWVTTSKIHMFQLQRKRFHVLFMVDSLILKNSILKNLTSSCAVCKLSTTAWLPLSHLLSLIHANTSNWLLTPTACRCSL